MADATRPTVLAVDDEPGILDSVRLELEDELDVLTARSGVEALELVARRQVDVILLDLRMPDMPGEEVLRRLSTARLRPTVIVMSAVREIGTVVECIKLGAEDYVTKPWQSGELSATIQRSLRTTRAEPSVLLVSDDATALAHLQVALHPHVRVATASVATATECRAPALIVVVYADTASNVAALSGLSAHFPGSAVLWVSDDLSVSRDLGALPNRLDLLLGRVRAVLGDRVVLPTQLPRAVIAAIDLMVSHCRNPLTLNEIAARVNISEDHLGRLFRQALCMPAASYYTRLRIAVACRLLKDTDNKIDDVAVCVGYSGAAKLSRAFKEITGIRPGEFRRQELKSQ